MVGSMMGRRNSPRFTLSLLVIFAGFLLEVGAGAAEDPSTLVESRVREWQPTSEERMLDRIGWAKSLVEARRLAKEHHRPLFVFTYSGSPTQAHAIALQRC